MYLVQIREDYFPTKHSIWNTEEEAQHQRDVLIKNGYKDSVSITFIETDKYENGYYFV